MIIVFTGNGKGKTTAALGQALRTVGQGKKVLMVQFIKGPWKSGEDFSHKRLEPDFVLKKMGLGFVGILDDTLPLSEHVRAAEEAFSYFETSLRSRAWDMLILDEINVAVDLGLLSPERVLTSLNEVPLTTFVLLTGRGAHPSFIERADLVTEMREIKHPFNDGKLAQIALDF